MIPIIIKHDADRVIGTFIDGVVTFIEPSLFDKDDVFNIFGCIGMQILEQKGKYIKSFKIVEWSF